ncbi:H-NS family nucleoid-associated regulatory protein [Glaesserella parasuis]|nr:H-NS histone family protein [Glaesserella parasuis 174]MCT8756565.1 H-NS histone family protein [Glaesserella parasuis]MDD2170380.1 H-NS histone family protein [Glaesserella parasuis]MDO9767944.1 H-NS family nucleoid-associated regulatory protein [Glaesserella parasuis]MDP0107461.1 H-NS family nucleoid-associated regulatory protein [Glaesserella parasuis]
MEKITKADELKIVAKYLTTLTSLRYFARNVELNVLEKAENNLKVVYQEQKDAYELENMEIAEQEAKRQALLKQLEEQGWSVDALLTPVTAESLKKSKVADKYVYTDNGKTRTWSGRGKMPVALRMQIEQGRMLDEFLVTK